jgi:hypothetical protein
MGVRIPLGAQCIDIKRLFFAFYIAIFIEGTAGGTANSVLLR